MKNAKQCKWYNVCPMKIFYEQGRLKDEWIKEFCFGDYLKCQRYKLEEKGIAHPDTMLPDGSVDQKLD